MKKRIALLLAASVTASAFLAGCSGKTETGTGDQGTDAPKAAEKQELVINLGEEPPNLDSAKTTDSVSFDVLGNVMEGLVRFGEGFKILPGIAENWEISPDGKVYTFKLRQNAKWSDGKPVTSKDFKFAWLRALDPKTASEYGYQLYYIVGGEEWNTLDAKAADFDKQHADLKSKVGIETPDDYTLKVTLKAPTPYFLGLMTFPTYLPQREDIVGQHGEKYAADADKMVFNGPFVIENWTHEDSLVLKKNANYWDSGVVKLEQVTFKMVKDSNTAVQMYEAGELDRVGLTGEFIPKYQSDPGFVQMADVATQYLTFNLERKEFQNANLRKAFNLAIDRKGFADNVLKNGSIPAEGFVPPSMPAPDQGKSFRAASGGHINLNANKEEAKKYWELALKELGVTSLKVSILSSDSAAAKRYVQGLMEMLQSNLPGLTVENEPVAFAVRLDRTRKAQFDVVFQNWIGDYNDPMTFMNMFVTDGPYNDAGWSNKAYDELIKKAESTGDNKVRVEAMAQAEKLMMAELPFLPLYHTASNRVFRPYVKGILDFPLGAGIDLKNAYVEGKSK